LNARVHRDLEPLFRLMADDPRQVRARPVRRRLAGLLDALERTRARYAVCGAVAMGAHGARRFTEDIDVLIDAGDLDPVVSALSRSKRARSATGVDVDLMVPVDAAEDWALATAVRARAFGRKLDVISPEALVVLKLRAFLSDPESRSGGKHRVDALTVLQTVKVDLPELRRFVSGHAELAGELERCLAAPAPRGRVR
jgi:hypothetical protein